MELKEGANVTEADLIAGCQLALAYDVASVCMLPYFLPQGAAMLRGSGVRASTTIGFPHGGHTTAMKLAEAQRALAVAARAAALGDPHHPPADGLGRRAGDGLLAEGRQALRDGGADEVGVIVGGGAHDRSVRVGEGLVHAAHGRVVCVETIPRIERGG